LGKDTVHNRTAGRQITANPAALLLIKSAAVTRFCNGFDFRICGCGNSLLLAACALGAPDLAAISFLVATAVADDSLSL
jgi:Flp pilus assembly protein protease CpaA